MHIQVSEGISAIETLAPEWESLIPSAPGAAFSHPYWYLAWNDAFRPQQVSAITARDGGRLKGVLPLARVRSDSRGLYFSRVAPFALGDYQPFVVDPATAGTTLPEMLDAAIERYGRRGTYWWPHVPESDPSLEILRSYLKRNGMPWVEEREGAPRLTIEGQTLEAVEQKLSSKLRGDVRRSRKKLAEEHGSLSLWTPASADEGVAALDEFFDVHDSKWLSEGLPGQFRNEVIRTHFKAVMRRLWGRGIHFSTVRAGDVNISYHFGFLSAGWLLWFRPTYRLDFHRHSPSKIHVAMLIEEACRSGWNGIDFLLGEEPYKYRWANGESHIVNIHAGFHEWGPSYFWFSRGKPMARQRFQHLYARIQAMRQKRPEAENS